eukprot:GCRY01001937.1.p1 GENE.GCRY01001937.1~~GCRY01001937.1.p1  ORF type:complete len:290 (+),score=52.99 GCRY01001937.1:104-871(+)
MDVLFSTVETTFGLEESQAELVSFALIGVCVLVLFSLIFGFCSLTKDSIQKGSSLLLLGPSGSGKSALFLMLKNGEQRETHMSMKCNSEKFSIHGAEEGSPITVVDIPGHERLRFHFNDLVKTARCLVFLCDSADFTKNITATSDYLYDVLTHPIVNKLSLPVLIGCNKSDLSSASSVSTIQTALEDTLDKVRYTRQAMPEVNEETGESLAPEFLGIDGERFTFAQCAVPVSLAALSVVRNDLAPLHDYIRENFP